MRSVAGRTADGTHRVSTAYSTGAGAIGPVRRRHRVIDRAANVLGQRMRERHADAAHVGIAGRADVVMTERRGVARGAGRTPSRSDRRCAARTRARAIVAPFSTRSTANFVVQQLLRAHARPSRAARTCAAAAGTRRDVGGMNSSAPGALTSRDAEARRRHDCGRRERRAEARAEHAPGRPCSRSARSWRRNSRRRSGDLPLVVREHRADVARRVGERLRAPRCCRLRSAAGCTTCRTDSGAAPAP